MTPETSPSYSITVRLRIEDKPGNFARIASAIGAASGNLGALDLVGTEHGHKVRDVTIDCHDERHAQRILDGIRALPDVNEAIRLNPKYPYAYRVRGLIYARIGLREPAIRDLRHALKLKPDIEFVRDELKKLGAKP